MIDLNVDGTLSTADLPLRSRRLVDTGAILMMIMVMMMMVMMMMMMMMMKMMVKLIFH